MKSLLSPVLSAGQCASCKFCCTFAAFEAWETPLFSKDDVEYLTKKYGAFPVRKTGNNSYTLDLSGYWKMHGEKEYAPCPFLDKEHGCILAEEEKPFDCKIWPLRIMRKEEEYVIALTPTCRELNKLPLECIKQLVNDEDTADIIFEEAEKMPDIIKEYREGFPMLKEKAADPLNK
jgi:Fe-S-cluster containining protein